MIKNLHLTMVSKYFYPEPCSTGQLLMEIALGLQKKGCKLDVITGQARLVGKSKLPPQGNYKNINIRRVWCTALNNNSVFGKAMNRITFSAAVFLSLLAKNKLPLLVTSDPPFLFWVTAILKRVKKINFIYLLYDIHPDASIKLGYLSDKNVIGKIWDQINKLAYRAPDFIVVPGESMKKTLIRKFPYLSTKINVIHNWADGDFIKPINKNDNWFYRKYDLIDKFVVLYSGNLGQFHDLETVIMAADRLRHLKDIKFVFIGDGDKKQKIMKMSQDMHLKNVLFLPFQPREYLPYSLTCGDVSVVTLEKRLEGLSVPCKLYTALAAGQAVWGLVGSRSEIAEIIERYKCGFRSDQKDVERAVKILSKLYSNRQLLNSLKRNARRCFEKNFEKNIAVEKYFEIIEKIQ